MKVETAQKIVAAVILAAMIYIVATKDGLR